MAQNERVYAIFCRTEIAGGVIYGENVKTIEGYRAVNFENEVASSNSFWDIQKNHFVTAADAASADIDDSIMRKRIRVSLINRQIGFQQWSYYIINLFFVR